MATNIEVNELKINKMKEATLSSMEQAGTIEPNQIFVTDDSKDTMTGVEQKEIIYDSTDSTKDWGYSGGITNGTTITGKDFTKYKRLRIYVSLSWLVHSGSYDVDLNNNYNQNAITGNNVFYCDYANNILFCYESTTTINSEKTSLTHTEKMLGHTGWVNNGIVIYKIEGVY